MTSPQHFNIESRAWRRVGSQMTYCAVTREEAAELFGCDPSEVRPAGEPIQLD